MPYSEDVAAVRAARRERDAARHHLYLLQLRRVALGRALARKSRGEGARDPRAEAELRSLRAQRAAAEARRKDIAQQLEALGAAKSEAERLREQLKAAPGRIAAAAAEVTRLAAALQGAEKEGWKRMQDAVTAAQSRRAALRESIDADRKKLARAETKLDHADRLEKESQALATRITQLSRTMESADERASNVKLGEADEQNRGDMIEARGLKARREADLRERIEDLYGGRGPEELIASWDDGLPITLLPLRIQTRWKTGLPRDTAELWVRVYPDDIGVTSHEALLTPAEIEHGEAYWSAYRAANDAAARSLAWDTLALRFGGNRAAWVAKQCRPLNWDAALDDDELMLDFPEQATKPNAWTSAPHSRVLPDRFVLMAWRGEIRRIFEVARPVDDIVFLGPSPVDAPDDDASISREFLDNSLKFGEAFEWVRNFERAVDSGLGFRVRVSAEDVQQGFDRLLVLGLKLSADAPDGQALLEDLIDSHHYSNAGFELLPQGTPTNNTDGNDSGYARGGDTGVAGAGPARFTPADDRGVASDGQRFADFLGIRYEPLLHVDGADRRDHAEAVAMNRALYAGTLGYYLDQMLNEVVADSARGALRHHFTDHVTGRGPIAAIRVGNQPYGILPTSSLARWQPRRDGVIDVAHHLRLPFEAVFVDVLRAFDQQWTAKLEHVTQLDGEGNGAENLLGVLGLHPTSAEFYQRVGYSYDYLRNLESFAWGGSDADDVMRMYIEAMAALPLLRRLGYQNTRPNGAPKPLPALLQLIWRHYQTQLDPKQLIDGMPLSETEGIKPYGTAGAHYIDWLIANASNATALERQDFGGAPRPGALLYMMLHFASVMESGRAIHDWLGGFEIQADELVRSRKFLNVSDSSPSVWEVFRAPARSIAAATGSSEPLLAVVHAPQVANGAGAALRAQKAALEVLRALPTARLERALVEHIDTLSYRLDAWQTSLFTRRLHAQRGLDQPADKRRTGAYVGAYGYLENVRRRPREREAVAGEDNLFTEVGNGGYVHAPSLNHATAAALLRNGYLTHASPADPEALAVNLSSGRVQRAKYLIDGIRNGQSLETLLGVQFERGLHDWTTRNPNPVILDQLKPLLRAAFPILRTRVPQAAGAAGGAAEVREDHQVVNGLTLARNTTAFPWGVNELSTLSAEQQNALRAEKASIENTLDALRDVLTTESAYQLALGNFDRAAAVLQSAGSATLPPDIEVLDTPRGTQLAFTQRLAVQFDATVAANPWNPIALTERARLEPALNAWLGDLIGTPDTIVCRVAAVDAAGAVLSDGAGPIQGTVSVAALGVQPIDFVYLVRSQTEPSGAAELETRVRHVFASARNLAEDVIVRISFADAGGAAGARSFAEVLPLADRLRKLLGAAKPLDSRHFHSASKDPAPPTDNPGRIDLDELRARVAARVTAVGNLLTALKNAVDTARASVQPADVSALRAALLNVARSGVGYAMPRSVIGTETAQRDILVAQADALVKRAEELELATTGQLAEAATATSAEKVVTLLANVVKAWLGADMVLLPRFVYGDVDALRDADATRADLVVFAAANGSILPVDEWLHGVACVRERVHEFEMVRLMADAARVNPLPLAALQLPFRTGDSWLGARFPATMQVAHDTMSMVQHLPQGFAAAGLQCGLLIDEWNESIPNRDEVTGLTFNFNAPNSAPPQAILLAVSPNATGSWSWDDLVDSVLDTFRRAKLRAVEPDSLGDLPGIGTLLPAVVAEFSTSPASVSLDYSMVLSEIRMPVLAMMAANTDGG